MVWERGLGYANLEARIPARPDTPYAIGDLTEPLTAVLVLRCAEERRLALDREITNYGGAVPNDRASVRQVLSHTSAPTGVFKFEPARYAQLTGAVEFCSRQSFRKTIASQLLDRLAMSGSVPGRDFAFPGTVPRELFDESYVRALPPGAREPGRALPRGQAPQPCLANRCAGGRHQRRDRARLDRPRPGSVRPRPRPGDPAARGHAGSRLDHRIERRRRAAAGRARLVRPELSRRASGLAVSARSPTRIRG